ncbi:hypothetical protein CYLTODRAFT_380189 [Cylindrobasidium torrendii FP15055 ss-10]|uniref:Uncharacterized protein n=1 Tax=Cylindrobasidium torrendii FP15055 ss-10 TaxID=1314674 RepID=A0A0D7B443_9AGAR|nr:hypothetical protein CYLTODRAFT_380189 [Cylindrobasidium torrendii FP15055 ss-10]
MSLPKPRSVLFLLAFAALAGMTMWLPKNFKNAPSSIKLPAQSVCGPESGELCTPIIQDPLPVPPPPEPSLAPAPPPPPPPTFPKEKFDWEDPKNYVTGTPGTSFRDSLRQDINYVTAFCLGGFSNQVICFANLIYLGILSNRVPVVPAFTPSHHISYEEPSLPFSAVFDIDYLRRAVGYPILEWSDIKEVPAHRQDPYPAAPEPLGCWTIRAGEFPYGPASFWEHLHLDTSFTDVPDDTYFGGKPEDSYSFTTFWKLAALIFPKDPLHQGRTYDVRWPSEKTGLSIVPDQHMSCFDTSYYVSTEANIFEWEKAWSPAWRSIGSNLHFTEEMIAMATNNLRHAFGLSSLQSLPPFVSVHVRRGDFKDIGFAPLADYEVAVEEVIWELELQGIRDPEVFVSSDEKSAEFWEDVEGMGWTRYDHDEQKTEEKYGEWIPPIIDTVMHSLASGFVGSGQSTYSLIAQRRVEDWHEGPTRIVKLTR